MNPNVELEQWLVNAYTWLRERAGLMDAPVATGLPEDSLRIFPSFPKGAKKVKGETKLSEVHFGCIEPAGLRGVDMILIHPAAFANPLVALKELLISAIRVSLAPDVKNRKPFQIQAARLGFNKPWALPDWEDAVPLLREALVELGDPPIGAYVEPVKEEKAGAEGDVGADPEAERKRQEKKKVKLFCSCDSSRPVEAKVGDLLRGMAIICGNCKEPFEPQREIGVAWAEQVSGETREQGEQGRPSITETYSEETEELFAGV